MAALRQLGSAAALTLVTMFAACGPQPPAPSSLPVPRPTVTYPLEPTRPSLEPAPRATPTAEPRERAPDVPISLTVGSKGIWVRRMQRALTGATYDPGPVDGRFGEMTLHAVYAFQKVNGIEPGAVVARPLLRRMLRAERPRVQPRGTWPYVEVDIGRQVLFEVEDGMVVATLPVSTGNGAWYGSASGVAIAHTPRGTFSIERKIPGWHVGYLGAMYYPSYFSNGYAIHGSVSVPPFPASHGCVRIPLHSTIGFYARNPVGTEVYVHD